MFKKLKRQWRDIRRGPPGKRFQLRYEDRRKQRCSLFAKPLYLLLGTAVLLVGLVLLPAPGPGVLVVLIGAATVAQESLWVARALDRLELRLRAYVSVATRAWNRASAAAKALVLGLGASVAAGAGWMAFLLLAGNA